MTEETMPREIVAVDFHFDIMCPWAYQASLWIRDVRAQLGFGLLARRPVSGFKSEHRAGIRNKESFVALKGEQRIAAQIGEGRGSLRCHADIQHGVHHARHR